MSIVPDWSLRTPDERAAIDASMRAQLLYTPGGVDFNSSVSPDYVPQPATMGTQPAFGSDAVPGQALSGRPTVPDMTLGDYLTAGYYGANNAVIDGANYASGIVNTVQGVAQSTAGAIERAQKIANWVPYAFGALILVILLADRR